MRKIVDIQPGLCPMWTVAMAAKYMNVGTARIRKLARQGRLSTLQTGGRLIMLDRDEVLGFKKRPGGRPALSQAQQKEFEIWLEYGMFEKWMKTCAPSLMPGECCMCGKKVGTVIPENTPGMSVRVAVRHYPKHPIAMKLSTGRVVKARCPGGGKVPRGWRTHEEPVGRF